MVWASFAEFEGRREVVTSYGCRARVFGLEWLQRGWLFMTIRWVEDFVREGG